MSFPNLFKLVTLRASAPETSASPQNGTAVGGFGAWRELEVFVDITAVSFTGGTSPTAQLDVWLQRTPDGGTTWDDVIALQSSALAAAATEKLLGFVNTRIGTPAAPAAVQAAGGSPPFAQRVGTISEEMRVAWDLTMTGSPTTQSVTFSVVARGRP